MERLIETIGRLRERIKVHRAALSKNETMTRYVLIDPLLRELGWELSNPYDVVPEDRTGAGGKTDYTMGTDAMIVEAKKLDENLDKYTKKLTRYVRDKDVRYGVLTNGQKWRMYDSQTSMKSPEVEFDVTDSEGVVISKATQLHRSVVLDSIPRQPAVIKGKAIFEMGPFPVRIPKRLGHNVDLPTLKSQYTKDMIRPNELVCPDKRVALDAWVDILAGVADWLVNKKHLGKSHCPVPIGSKNAILNTKPFHQNDKPFATQREVGRLYVNTKAGPTQVIQYAIKLIKAAGLKPSDFKVYFEDPAHPDPSPTTDGST